MQTLRVAWLLTSAFYYWQPMLSHLAQKFPQMIAFTAKSHGYAPGLENTFALELVGQRKIVSLAKDETGYGSNVTFLSLGIVKRLLQFRPQVIFSNSFGLWTLLALLLKPLGRWRVVIAYEGSSPGVDYRNSPPRLRLRRWMVRLADACISNSHAGKDYLVHWLNAPPERVFVQPYEVPALEMLSKVPADQTQPLKDLQRPIFLYVGSLIPRKGIQFLLEACTLLQQQDCRNYTLCIVGDGEQRSHLETLVKERGLSAQVHWVGRVDYADLGHYFQQADVFVLPTLEDTWGVVVSEALLLGKPVLCSQFAGAVELIVPGENGDRFDPHDTPTLAKLMRQFIEQPATITRMGQRAQTLMANYSPAAAAQFLANVAKFVWER